MTCWQDLQTGRPAIAIMNYFAIDGLARSVTLLVHSWITAACRHPVLASAKAALNPAGAFFAITSRRSEAQTR